VAKVQKKHSTLFRNFKSVEHYPQVDGFMTNNFTMALKNNIKTLKRRLVADQKKVKLVVVLLSS